MSAFDQSGSNALRFDFGTSDNRRVAVADQKQGKFHCPEFIVRSVRGLQNPCRISCRDGIGWNRPRYHRTCRDCTAFTDFSHDDGSCADPAIGSNRHALKGAFFRVQEAAIFIAAMLVRSAQDLHG